VLLLACPGYSQGAVEGRGQGASRPSARAIHSITSPIGKWSCRRPSPPRRGSSHASDGAITRLAALQARDRKYKLGPCGPCTMRLRSIRPAAAISFSLALMLGADHMPNCFQQSPRDSILFTYWDNLEYGLRNGHRGILNRTSPSGWLQNRRPQRLEPRRGEPDCSALLFTSALNPTMMK
jgi:hypothetical protein